MNSTFWRSNHQWNKIVDEKFPHSRSADNQQIVGSTAPDVMKLVFPAIGAILMLVFGGFLLSSTTSCCGSERKGKRNNRNEDYEGIDFTFLSGSIVFPRLSPVLQQENNDVVEAVMATYSDLPQYAPAHDELAAIAGTISVTKPETRDVCLSPIQETSHIKIPVDIEKDENDPSGLYDGTGIPHSCSDSGEAPRGIGWKNDRRLACSAMETRTLSDQKDNQVQRSKSAPLKITHDKNTKQGAFSLDEQLALDTSHDSVRSDAQVDCNDVERCSAGLYSKPCDGVSLADDRMTSPLTEFQIQNSIGEIAPGQGLLDASHQWKRPAKLSKKDRLEILKRLQPKIDDEVSHKKVNEKQPDRKTENTNIKCEGNDMSNCAKGGRLSRLRVVRAPSALCIHDNQCNSRCRTAGDVTDKPGEVDNNLNDSGRGASCFAESFRHSTSMLRGASAFGGPTRGASVFGELALESRDNKSRGSKPRDSNSRDFLPDSYHLTDVRGASSFGGAEFYSSSKGQIQEDVIRTYGEATSCWLTGVSGQGTNDMRGASGFGESCDRLSVTGTASVTLSMAVQSEKEDLMEDDDSLENIVARKHEDGVAKQPNEINLGGKTERLLVEQNNDTNNEQGGGSEYCDNEDGKNRLVTESHSGNVERNTTELTVEPKRRACLHSNDDVHVQSTSLPQQGDQGSLRDSIIKRKAIEVIQTRGTADLAEDGPNRASTPNDGTITTRDTRMSLGKDPRALAGLLKALQREKLKKTSKKKEELPTSLQNNYPALETTVVHGNGSLENANIDTMRKDGGHTKQLVGKIKVCLFYTRSDTDKPVLYATVLKAYSLRHEYVRPKEDFLVEMLVSTRDNSTQKSKVIKEYKNSLVFNHLFHVPSIKTRELQISALKLMIVSGRSHECVGIANVPLADLVSRDKIKKTYLLRRVTSASYDTPSSGLNPPVPAGAVCIGLKYNSVEEKLLVHIIKVRGLPAVSSTGETDPYVLVTVKDDGNTLEERMTVTKWQQRNPVFDVKYVFEVNRDRIETCSLLLRVMNNAANHSLIGTVKIGMDSLEDSGRYHWNNIVTKPGMLEERWHKLLNKTSDIKVQTQDP